MNYQITKNGGVYTAAIPYAMENGNILLVEGRADIRDTYRDFGLNPDEVGGLFGSIGKFFKKVTKNKAFRKALKISKKIFKSPITTAALGVVTGGAAIAPLAAANIALNVADSAAKHGKKGKAARKLIRGTMKLADKDALKRRKLAFIKKRMIARGLLTPAALAKIAARRVAIRKQQLSKLPIGERANSFLLNTHFGM